MPKQEYKIQSFHGGSNNKFDPRDIEDNQNAFSQFSIRNPGRLTLEGSAMTLYNKTGLNDKTINDIGGSKGFKGGYGLFAFSHDYSMQYDDIISAGTTTRPGVAEGFWTRRDAGGVEDGWTEAEPSAFEDDETASLINTLSGDAIDAEKTYRLSFDVGVAALTLAIGGASQSTGGSADDTYIAATSYAVGSHSVVFTAPTDRSHLWFTATGSGGDDLGTLDNVSCYRMPDEVDTEFVVTNDGADIDIYDPNKSSWQDAKFRLGSRTATVKPSYYNVDGALRSCDSSFEVTDTGETVDMTGDVSITKNDVDLKHTSGTITLGSIIQIDQELMYVTSGSSTSTDITVIRGFANTKIATHAHNSKIYYANVPKYFGHIKQDRLFECDTSNSINAWVEDVQTPQPPNNTRKSDGATGTLASSLGVQSLRIYDLIEGSTSNYPAESEKVVLEFREGVGDVGIIRVEHVSGTTLRLTTSGRGASTTLGHKLTEGTMISIDNVQTSTGVDLSNLSGTFEVLSTPTATTFTIQDDNFSASMVEDATPSGDAAYSATVDGWTDYNATVEGHVKVSNDEANLPGLQGSAGDTFPIHITGQTGVPSYNGIHIATMIDADDLSFPINTHASVGDVAGTTEIQQLLGIVRPEGSGAINEDLKRKWNFAMSFTYDGPGQEVQESLLTMGHTIVPLDQNDGNANRLAAAMGDTSTTANHDIDDASVLSVGDIIMVDSEQMLITAVDTSATPDHINVTRGYNGSTAATHSDDAQIYKITELSPTATVDWTNFIGVPECVIKTVYNHGVDEKTWNARINGFKIYMRDVTEGDSSKEWRLFSDVNFNKGTYTLFAADDSELILEQPGTWSSDGQVCTISTGTELTIKPVDTYLSENLFTEETIIDAQYKAIEVVGRRAYIGNIRQGGRTYPDRMLRTPVNKFDTFPETNYIDVAVGDGDSITALKSFGDRLLQFKKNKVYIINVAGESEVLEAEYNNAGITYPSQITKTNDGIAWVNDSGLWYFDGKQVQNLTLHVEDDGYALGTDDKGGPKIGFYKKENQIIYTPRVSGGIQTPWYIYNLNLKAYQGNYFAQIFPFSESNDNYYTNMINDSNGDLVIGYVDDATNNKINFYTWTNSDRGHQYMGGTNIYKSKDIDLGSPGVRKKIYKVYVTYKCTGHSGVEMKYTTDGGTSFSSFSSSKSSNYDVETFTANGTRTGFKNSSGEWAVAELKPSSSINNIKSIQFSLDQITVQTSTAQNGGDSTSIILNNSDASTTDDIYNDYNIYIHGGTARYNSSLIENDSNGTGYNGTSKTVTLYSAMTNKGYTNQPSDTSKYVLGSIASDFEINDITIVYRMKRVK